MVGRREYARPTLQLPVLKQPLSRKRSIWPCLASRLGTFVPTGTLETFGKKRISFHRHLLAFDLRAGYSQTLPIIGAIDLLSLFSPERTRLCSPCIRRN